jgi:hypothetical protein
MLNTVVDATTPPPQRFSSEEQLLQPLPEVYDKVQRTATQPTQPGQRAAMRGNTAQPRRDRRSGREAVGTEPMKSAGAPMDTIDHRLAAAAFAGGHRRQQRRLVWPDIGTRARGSNAHAIRARGSNSRARQPCARGMVSMIYAVRMNRSVAVHRSRA